MSDLKEGIVRVDVAGAEQAAHRLLEGLIKQYQFSGAMAISLAMVRQCLHTLLHTQTPFFETNILTMHAICRDLLTFVKDHEACCEHLNGKHKNIPKSKMS